jgi:hypothetical protein
MAYWDKKFRKFYGSVYEGISGTDIVAILSHVILPVGYLLYLV